MDVRVIDHGSVVMVAPLTAEARRFAEENVALESWQWLGDAFAVEPRYVGDLVDGMEAEGLEVEVVGV